MVVQVPDEQAHHKGRHVQPDHQHGLVEELEAKGAREESKVGAREHEERLRGNDEVEGDDGEDDVVKVVLGHLKWSKWKTVVKGYHMKQGRQGITYIVYTI